MTADSTAMVSTSPALSPARPTRREPNNMANSAMLPATSSTSSLAETLALSSGSSASSEAPTDCNCNAM
ncbi:hypothetical protein SD421_15580 [Qipengyuania sp. HL-TH1]|uniref:hypothetical protein n=1 Tax=Qipengyuania profunda TaxID=3113984 RepID=UPI002A189879|nr:hypothetical protein [Qipengyuania sp. HL-TH1]WPL56840.1 hypothetical protein SD421_15580 [Qipengyuania sp. HL-TH5]